MSIEALRTWQAVHKWTSLVCTLFLLLLCLTGLPLIFRDEIESALSDDKPPAALPESTPDTDLDRLVDLARHRYPKDYVRSLFWDRARPHVITMFLAPSAESVAGAQDHFMAFDARTGEVLDERGSSRGFMSVILKLHENLLLGLPGELFLGLIGILFTASIVSGVVLYAPFMRKLAFGTIRRRQSTRLKWLDLHNLLGISALIWLFVVGATGVMNTLATPLFGLWRAHTLPALLAHYRGLRTPPPDRFVSVTQALETTRRRLPDNDITSVVFPSERFGSPRHVVIWTKGRTPVTSRLFTPVLIDVESGALVQAAGLPWYLRALEVSRPLHFGDYGGLPLKLLWGLFDLVAIVVLGSGVYLWLARRSRFAESA